jgi:hypothetical protein
MGVHGDAGASGRAKSLVARVWGGTAEDERRIHRQLRTLRTLRTFSSAVNSGCLS